MLLRKESLSILSNIVIIMYVCKNSC